MNNTPIYLDYNGTTPIHPEVRKMLIDTLSTQFEPDNVFLSHDFGNPSSTHYYGIESKITVNNARKQVAKLLNCHRDEIVFTSGGTESNNIAIQGVVCQAFADNPGSSPHILTTAFEHPSVENVLQICKRLFSARVTTLPVDKYGFLNIKQLRDSLTPETVLVTIMLANNEVGTINQMQPLFNVIQEYNNINKMQIKLHMDCSQAAGKVAINSQYADLLTIAGHKMYAPKGVGCLYIKRGLSLFRMQEGANQEQNRRPGTENVLLIKALGLAAEIYYKELPQRQIQHSQIIEHIYKILSKLNHKINGYAELLLKNNQFSQHFTNTDEQPLCLPNTLNISFPGVLNSSIIAALQNTVCVSAGAACHSDAVEVSAVLKAIGVTSDIGMGTLRISVGDGLTLNQAESAANQIFEAVSSYQPIMNVSQIDSSAQELSKSLSQSHQQQEQQLKPQAQYQLYQQPKEENKDATNAKTFLNGRKNFNLNDIQITQKLEAPANSKNAAADQVSVSNAQSKAKQNMLNFTQGLGCACKIRPQLLDRILRTIDFGKDPNCIIDTSTNDDAAVYLPNNGAQAVVLTTDFFSPVIDDAYLYGKIAAANALSDIYAMNARPRTCLAVMGFNTARLSEFTIQQIMQGAVDKCRECSCIIAGGHSIESIEPFFGLVCLGYSENQQKQIKRNVIQQLDNNNVTYLIMTKKIGVGMVTNALKKGILQKLPFFEQIYNDAVKNMTDLNDCILNIPDDLLQHVTALTDITGFGLIGHLSEMLHYQYSAELYFKSIPVIQNVDQLFEDFESQIVNNFNNLEYAVNKKLQINIDNSFIKAVMCDPVTSGGLLLAVRGIEAARQIAQIVNGVLIGRVYQSANEQQEIVILDEAFRDVRMRYGGFFKE